VVSDVASILAGLYQTRVSQYGASAAQLGTVFVSVPGNNPSTTYTTANVENLITSAIEGGALPEPWGLQGIRYIATVAGNSRSDNLLSLPEC